jgi:hypothetical protein
MATTEDNGTSSGSGRGAHGGRYLSVGLGASGLLGFADNQVPWWGLLLWSILALTVIALQTVMPQESRDRVSVLGMAGMILLALLALLFRQDRKTGTAMRNATKPGNRRRTR